MQGQNVVVISGSKGIGLEVARQALARGARVTIAARGEAALAGAAAFNPGLETAIVDAADSASVRALFARFDTVDHIYHSAGTFIGGPASGDVDANHGVCLLSRPVAVIGSIACLPTHRHEMLN